MIVTLVVFSVVLVTTIVSGILLSNKIKNSTIVYADKGKTMEITDENEVVEIENNLDGDLVNNSEENRKNEDSNNNVEKINIKNQSLSLCLLGEIMMGGQVGQNLNYSYASAFKRVYSKTRQADFTYANFSTNITNLEKIEDPKSKYIVTKDSLSALKALGIDCVSLASDHIVDFSSDILKNTINTLESQDIFVAGRENTPVYFQKGQKRVAIVSTNSVINGTASLYKKDDISIYDESNFAKNIKEAKDAADVVIADIHWGNEYSYGVTDKMRQIAKVAVDSGANLVIR